VIPPRNPSGFVIQRGTNLSHWLSQDFGWAPRDSWITGKDFRFIAAQGFDHVRLPIDEKELWLASGRPNAAEFSRLLQGIDWAREAGLRVIVDLHTVNAHHFNAANEGLTNTTRSSTSPRPSGTRTGTASSRRRSSTSARRSRSA
jgi:endoglucanase